MTTFAAVTSQTVTDNNMLILAQSGKLYPRIRNRLTLVADSSFLSRRIIQSVIVYAP